MANYPRFNVLANEAPGPAANIGDNRMTQGIGFNLVPVSQAGSGPDPYPGPVLVLVNDSFDSQNPTGLGPGGAVQISFGPAIGTPADPVQIDGLGTIIVNQAGVYAASFSVVARRSTVPGTVNLLFRLLVDGVQFRNPALIVMGDAADSHFQQFTITGSLPSGTVIRAEMMRQGANNGGLISTPSDWGATPAASIRVLRY